MADPRGDAALKASQAKNFDDLNVAVETSPFDRHLRFFNFGYRLLGDEVPIGPSLGPAFPNADSAQLLFQVIGATDLHGACVAELGCGRGGNLWLVRRHLDPELVAGVDIAPRSVAYAHRSMPPPGGAFVVGDAERVPLRTGAFDAVLSVETSCTYPDIEAFFREVARLVRPGGKFLYADLFAAELVDSFVAALEALGFELEHRRDITANVRASRDARAGRQKLAYGDTPGADRATMTEYVGGDGSHLHDLLTDGHHQYTILRFGRRDGSRTQDGPLLSAAEKVRVRQMAGLAVDLLTIPSASAPPDT